MERVILGDAIVSRAANQHDHAVLAQLVAESTSIAALVRAANAVSELRVKYPSAEALVLELLDLDARGALQVAPRPFGVALERYYRTRHANGDRSLSYIATYERNWQAQRSLYDFVEAADANAARKAFQRDNYLAYLGGHLDRLPADAAVLDAGCGVGRLTGALVRRGFRVSCVDASAEALKCAVRVGLRRGGTCASLDARLCDVREMSCFGDGAFAATVALELICYQDDPADALRELVRVTARGGLVALSVEGLHGSFIADPKLALSAQTKVLDTAALDIDHEISVRYFTKRGLRALLESAGLEVVEIVGTHYTADGVLDRLATDQVFADADELRSLAALERAAAADPVLEPLARAWLAVARVPAEASA